ncbi:hypothetical protein JDV02_000903 [Purpureocillium takamizusanense]|uniref:FR47-like domain-containing protein n=1 Tax=Purpureocillium takamizusanense TaxID=2060973 RepID=A0A9Q8V7B6_9HYPO|nr:uncharacterized protein JDV02_000903 [Purpureocillium takamizusanense]UNI14256.1 hypothetical protein JDV02_000903 [Purpureocillium takamizusanense]
MPPAVQVYARQPDGRFVLQSGCSSSPVKHESDIISFLVKRLPFSLPILRTIQFGAGVRNNTILCTVSLPHNGTPDAMKKAASFGVDDVWTIALIDRDNHPGTEIWPFSSLELLDGVGSTQDTGLPSVPAAPDGTSLPFSSEVLDMATCQLLAILSKVPAATQERSPVQPGKNSVLLGNVQTTLAALLSRAGLVMGRNGPYGKYIFSARGNPDAITVAPDGSSHGLPQGLVWSTVQLSDHGDILAEHERMSVAQLNELPNATIREEAGTDQGKAVAYAFTGRDGAVSTLYVAPTYRGMGLAGAVVRRLRDKGALEPPVSRAQSYGEIAESDLIAMAGVERSNAASIATFRRLGAQWRWDVYWLWVNLDSVNTE